MPVVSERSRQFLFFHDHETGAVGQTPVLVGHIAISLQRLFEELRCLWEDDNLRSFSKSSHRRCCCLAQTRPVITEAVQETGEDHFAGYDLSGTVEIGRASCRERV